ncbi:MAG: TIGR03936 family radical SAM-associated protein [Lachnospiraceae bacterium]|nr:TIGR03936 family radical SAM-associated protein [Lachnospiraceae bacterium]MDY4970417.1 TIGR03936 family radical SAM-associated protein [Lachnospiraceae bacterium]
MKIRIKFSKTGNLKYIGHLDIMRCFQKVMRRAEVDIAYSAGFSPHQVMSFASPLGLGVTSEGEYVDIEVQSSQSSETMLERINAVMVEGLQALSWVKLPDRAGTAMSVLAAADYRVAFDQPVPEAVRKQFEEFLSLDTLVVTKKTKKGEREVDIPPLIYQADLQEQTLFLQLCAGSAENLKPEQVMNAFMDRYHMEPEQLRYHVHRLEMYADLAEDGQERRLIPLERMGEVIV